MWETNLEKVLDTKADEAGLQLPEKDLTEKFSDKANRVTLVNEATKGFEWLDDKTKTEIKDKAATEIKSRANYPVKGEEWYNAKIAVLYLYTTLDKGTKNASLDEVKVAYDDLKAADVKDKEETTAKLEAGKKEATGALTTKLDEYTKTKDLYSKANWEALVYAETNGEKEITAAKTTEEIVAAKDLALKSMDNIFTLEEEKAAELKKVIDNKNNEQQEITKNPIEYTEKDGKRWYYEQQESTLPAIPQMKGGASNVVNTLNYKQNVFFEDQILNTFMDSYEKDESPFYTNNAEMFNYLAKNYPSLSKEGEINSEINAHIFDYLENNNTNTDYPDLELKSKEMTWVTLQINPESGLYYFDVPVSNLKKSTFKKYPDIKNIHLYSQWDMWDNVIINEGLEANTSSTTDVSEEQYNADANIYTFTTLKWVKENNGVYDGKWTMEWKNINGAKAIRVGERKKWVFTGTEKKTNSAWVTWIAKYKNNELVYTNTYPSKDGALSFNENVMYHLNDLSYSATKDTKITITDDLEEVVTGPVTVRKEDDKWVSYTVSGEFNKRGKFKENKNNKTEIKQEQNNEVVLTRTEPLTEGSENNEDIISPKFEPQKTESNQNVTPKIEPEITKSESSETIQELPAALSGVQKYWTRTKTWETYVMTPNTSVQYSQLNPFMTNELFKIKNNGFDIKYIAKTDNLGEPITSIEIKPTANDAVAERTPSGDK